MGLQYPDGRMVSEYCKPCSGTGFTMKSVAPVKFRTCWMCNGWRGKFINRKTAKRTPPMTDLIKAADALVTPY